MNRHCKHESMAIDFCIKDGVPCSSNHSFAHLAQVRCSKQNKKPTKMVRNSREEAFRQFS